MTIRREYMGCRSREAMEGRAGRRRSYKCRECGERFSRDTAGALPVKARVCDACYLASEAVRREYREAFGIEAVA